MEYKKNTECDILENFLEDYNKDANRMLNFLKVMLILSSFSVGVTIGILIQLIQ